MTSMCWRPHELGRGDSQQRRRRVMLSYAVRRLLGLIPVLGAALVLTFVANRFVPGDPVMVMLGDQSSNVELAASLRHQYGLDRPLWLQFLSFLGGLVQGDLGLSFRHPGVPVTEVIKDALWISPLLAMGALALAVPIGLALGIYAAIKRSSPMDTGVMLLVVTGLSVPSFALAAFMVWLFSLQLGWLPVAGWTRPAHAVLPVILLTIPPAAYIARLARTFMLEVLQQDYIRTARAKGLSERLVIWRH